MVVFRRRRSFLLLSLWVLKIVLLFRLFLIAIVFVRFGLSFIVIVVIMVTGFLSVGCVVVGLVGSGFSASV